MVLSWHRRVRDRAVSLAKAVFSPPRPLVRLGLVLGTLWGGSVSDTAAHPSGTQPPYSLSRTVPPEPRPGYTLEQAVAKVRAEVPGRILSAETVTREGRVIYRIKVLTEDGRVTVIEIDARSGKHPE